MLASESYMVHSIQLDLEIGDEHRGSSERLFSYWCVTLAISPYSTRREIKRYVIIVAFRCNVHLQNSYYQNVFVNMTTVTGSITSPLMIP